MIDMRTCTGTTRYRACRLYYEYLSWKDLSEILQDVEEGSLDKRDVVKALNLFMKRRGESLGLLQKARGVST